MTVSGYFGYRLDGSKLSKSEAQARINNAQTNMSLAFSGASMGQNAMNANGKPSNNKTNQASGSAFGEMSPEDTIAYDNYWNQVKARTTPEQRYDLKIYYNINGTSNYKINVQTSSKVDTK